MWQVHTKLPAQLLISQLHAPWQQVDTQMCQVHHTNQSPARPITRSQGLPLLVLYVPAGSMLQHTLNCWLPPAWKQNWPWA
jgi:hypothetical protein